MSTHFQRSVLQCYVVTTLMILAACSGSRELTRSRAQNLIQDAPAFANPVAVALNSDNYVEVEAKSVEEPENEVQKRAIPKFYERYPVMAILKQMGLISETISAVQKPWRPAFIGPTLLTWRFNVEPHVTDHAKELAAKEGLTEQQALALYRRKIVELTGVTKITDNKAEAQYSWKAVPTRLGQTFDANGPFVATLPAEQQKALRRSMDTFGGIRGPIARDYNEVIKGTANFQLFDDGWRLVSQP
jgi:hypothetical protein